MQKTVELIKASAGAGKTFFLTEQYIRLLLEGPEDSYKHILAVTFTNKATEEMKARIVEKLSRIAADSGDPRSGKAQARLTRILHDYSGFSISTIDSFFQTVMRAFAREIGQYASYRVEIDAKAVISRAVDMMLDSLSDDANADLLNWLKDYSFQVIQDGGSWNIKGPLENMAGLFFKEDFKLMLRLSGGTSLGDRKALRDFDAKLQGIINHYESESVRIGHSALDFLAGRGLGWDDFFRKSTTKIRLFEKWAGGNLVPATDALYESLSKMNPDALRELRALIKEAVRLTTDYDVYYHTALIIRKNLYLLGIYSDLYKQLHSYLSENNVVLLCESTDLLNRIIDGNDTPFVYEKIGNRFDHIMLDESQDTSVLQWGNFMPLFKESISKGHSNLIVGDIKQSIYRWRGSDWRLISDYVQRDLGAANIEDYSTDPGPKNPLGDNWRSGSNIVDFNNELFSKAGGIIGTDFPAAGAGITDIYSGCKQDIPKERKDVYKGRVKVGFIADTETQSWREIALERALEDIEELASAGYRHKDITVLVRTNKDGAQVAQYLISKGYDVMTEDSLLIGSSPCVASILNSLSCRTDPSTPANRLLTMEGTVAVGQNSRSLYELCENLIAEVPGGVAESQVPFVNAFLDCVLAYQDKYGSSLRGFIRWWDDVGLRRSICAPEGRDAIRVMTIHKSKGLSIEAVIVPFMEESFAPQGNTYPTIWCCTSGQLQDIALIPVKATSSLEKTIFREDYHREKFYEYVDAVNTAYVAFTRAKSQLIVYCPVPTRDKSNKYKVTSFSNLLHRYFNDADYALGELDKNFVPQEDSIVAESDWQKSFDVIPLGDRLRVSTRWEDYFDPDVNPRTRGIVFHDILSKVELAADLEKACGADAAAFKYLSAHMKAVEDLHWFDGTYRSLNEASIILPDGTTQRPDRVLVDESGSKAIVIDYKFGKQLGKYIRQVAQYCALIREMGYTSVSGYLWYVEQDTVTPVC